MNIAKRICRLLAMLAILGVAAGPVTSADRVNEVCVVAGDIDYCAPKDA